MWPVARCAICLPGLAFAGMQTTAVEAIAAVDQPTNTRRSRCTIAASPTTQRVMRAGAGARPLQPTVRRAPAARARSRPCRAR